MSNSTRSSARDARKAEQIARVTLDHVFEENRFIFRKKIETKIHQVETAYCAAQ